MAPEPCRHQLWWYSSHSFVHVYLLSTKDCAKISGAHKDTEFSELINLFTLSSTMYMQTIAISVMLKGLLQVCLSPNLFPYSVRLYSLAFICLFSFRNLFILCNLVHKHKQNVRLTNREVSKVWWHSENKLHYRSR